MNRVTGGLVVVIFTLLLALTIFVCGEMKMREVETRRFDIVQNEIEALREENKAQDREISALIKTQAMKGYFDGGKE